MINAWADDELRIKDGKKVVEDFSYNSETNSEWMSVGELQIWLKNNKEKMDLI